MKTTKNRDYREMKRAVNTIKIAGFEWIGSGFASFKGTHIDLTATEPTHKAIAYTTLIHIK